MIIAPIMMAITGFDGMPSVSIGMNDVCAPALLAASGPATPSIAPWPNRLGGWRYASSPVSTTRTKRASRRRPAGCREWYPSRSRAGWAGPCGLILARWLRSATLAARATRGRSGLSRLPMISGRPKTPMRHGTNCNPSSSSGRSNEKRSVPEFISVPMRPSTTPTRPVPIACSSEPGAITIAAIRPNTISAE